MSRVNRGRFVTITGMMTKSRSHLQQVHKATCHLLANDCCNGFHVATAKDRNEKTLQR